MTTETSSTTLNWATKAEREAGHMHAEGAKCDACGEAPIAWQPYGGAVSFSEADRYLQAQEIEMAAGNQVSMFESLERNVWQSDLDARQKAQAIQRLATELDERIASAVADPMVSPERAGQAAFRGQDAVSDDPGGTFIMRDKSGSYRWLTIHTNKFRDREGDIFSEAAHKAYVEWANETKSFPALRLWHTPIDFGTGDFVAYDDNGFVLASGTFKPGFEDVAERLASEKNLGCSHGYLYRPSDYRDGVYHAYRSYEVSVLPRARAANTLTSPAFFAGEEWPMLGAQQKEWLTDVLGEEKVKEIETATTGLRSAAEGLALSYKAMEETLMEARSKDDAPPVAEAPAAPAAPEATANSEPSPALTAVPPVSEGAPPAQEAPAAVAAEAEAEPPAESSVVPATPAAASAAPIASAPVVTASPEAQTPAALPSDPPQPTEAEQAVAAAALAAAGPVSDSATAAKALHEALGEVLSPVLAELRSVHAELAGIKAANAERDEQVAELAQGSDAHLAAMIAPRIGWQPGARAASQSEGNVLSEEAAEALRLASARKDDAPPPSGPLGYLDDAIGHLRHATGVSAA